MRPHLLNCLKMGNLNHYPRHSHHPLQTKDFQCSKSTVCVVWRKYSTVQSACWRGKYSTMVKSQFNIAACNPGVFHIHPFHIHCTQGFCFITISARMSWVTSSRAVSSVLYQEQYLTLLCLFFYSHESDLKPCDRDISEEVKKNIDNAVGVHSCNYPLKGSMRCIQFV